MTLDLARDLPAALGQEDPPTVAWPNVAPSVQLQVSWLEH